MSNGRLKVAALLPETAASTSAATDQKTGAATALRHSIVRSSHTSAIPRAFDMQGAIALQGVPALQREGQFALFGQWHDEKSNQRNGYLELRDSKAETVVVSTTTATPMLWHLSQLPPDAENHTRLMTLENNGGAAKNSKAVVRARVIQVHPRLLCKTPLMPVVLASQFPWLPPCVFHPPAAQMTLPVANPNDVMPQSAWRINLKAHQLEVHGTRGCVSKVPVFTSSQSVAYSPSYEHVISGDIGGRQAGLAVRTARDDGATGYHREPFPFHMLSGNFRGAAWFNNSHYAVFCNDGRLIFGNTNYPDATVTVTFDSPVHALVAIPNEPVAVASHTDGGVNVYDVSDALIELRRRHTPADFRFYAPRAASAAAPAAAIATTAAPSAAAASQQESTPQLQMLTQLAPSQSQSGLWGTRRRSDVLSDLAALHHANSTSVLHHERGSQTLSIFELRHKHTAEIVFKQLLESFIMAPDVILKLIVSYQFFFETENTNDAESTVSASAYSPSPPPSAARRHTM